jgi:peptidoglycan/xylan/chitin deacetylase (PgdA/CDA1 family)
VRNYSVILTFHGLGKPAREIPAEEEPFWIEPSFFEAVLDLIRGREDVHVTFDDSNASDYEIALPALAARKRKASIFVLAPRVGDPGYLSRRQLDELVSEGMTIGNHGAEHSPWTTLCGDRLRRELAEAKDCLEQMIGKAVTDAACPFGSYNRRVLQAVRNSGFDRLYTSDDLPAFADSWVQSRYTIDRTHSLQHISRIVNGTSGGLARLLARTKLHLKQWR